MAALREQTRRFWVSATFLLLGPIALAATSWHLYARAKQNVPVEESSYLSSQLGCDFCVGRKEFLSPGFSRYIDVRISTRSSSNDFLVCPEIYAVRTKDASLLEQLANSLDARKNAPSVGSDREEKLNEFSVSSDVATEEKNLTILESIRGDAFSDDLTYDIFVIPEIYVDAREVRQAHKTLYSFFSSVFRTLTSATQEVACFAVNRITIFYPENFENFAERVGDQSTPINRKKREVLEIASTLFRQTPRGSGGMTESSTKNEVLAFSTEPISINMTRALYVETENEKRLYGLFELQKISCPEPCYFAITTTNDCESAFSLYSDRTPLPGSFLSVFSDSFAFLQEEGWFTGRLDAYREPKRDAFARDGKPNLIVTEGRQTTRLTGCSFKRFDLRKIAASVGVSQFSGLVSELTIREGVVQDGMIEANGFARINEGTLPAYLIGRLHRLGKLDVSPSNATKLRFVNNATPFNKLELQFALGKDGVIFDSNYRNRIVAFYEQDALKYGFYLPQDIAGQTIPYAEILSDLYDSNDVQAAWRPFTKYVLSHVPLDEARSDPATKTSSR